MDTKKSKHITVGITPQIADPVRRDIEAHLQQLGERIAQIEKSIKVHIDEHEDLKRQKKLMQSAPGMRPVVCTNLLAYLPELGQLDRKKLASLAGLAPHARDSGTLRGKRRISGGRANVRCALYMAALSAARSNASFKSIKTQMQARGKPAKVILIAIARKLLTVLNAMIRDHKEYASP